MPLWNHLEGDAKSENLYLVPEKSTKKMISIIPMVDVSSMFDRVLVELWHKHYCVQYLGEIGHRLAG